MNITLLIKLWFVFNTQERKFTTFYIFWFRQSKNCCQFASIHFCNQILVQSIEVTFTIFLHNHIVMNMITFSVYTKDLFVNCFECFKDRCMREVRLLIIIDFMHLTFCEFLITEEFNISPKFWDSPTKNLITLFL